MSDDLIALIPTLAAMLLAPLFAVSLTVGPAPPFFLSGVRTPSPLRHQMSIRESRLAPITEIQPGNRYRTPLPEGAKYYKGRDPNQYKKLQAAVKAAGIRKLVVITGTSSGLGLTCVQALLARSQDDFFVVAAVRDPEKMDQVAADAGIPQDKFAAVELQLASFASVKDFATDLKKVLGKRGLDRLVCNAAVYLPTDPKPRFTDDGYEMSIQVIAAGSQ